MTTTITATVTTDITTALAEMYDQLMLTSFNTLKKGPDTV